MFIDKAKIHIKAGNGGNGCTSFYSSKLVNLGGPDGGDGGKGGDVIFVATDNMTTLLDFKYKSKYFAEDGVKGDQNNRTGKSGRDLIVKVPCGTSVYDAETGNILADLVNDGDSKVLLKGGSGGKGNAKFATSTRQAPAFSQLGVTTKRHSVLLELKTIADVGLVGFPNAGKSTILSVVSEAKPKIANYPFTTLSPNLGVVKYFDKSFVVADIPGLIEGAAEGAGLGHDFLRHIERVRLILHVVDISGSEGRDPYEDYLTIRKELKSYSARLAKLPEIIALNKCDLLFSEEVAEAFRAKLPKTAVIFPISAVTTKGIREMTDGVYNRLKRLKVPEPEYVPETNVLEPPKEDTFTVEKTGDVFVVSGGLVERLARNVVLSDPESFASFHRALDKSGIIAELRAQGIADGDTVRMLDIEFEYYV